MIRDVIGNVQNEIPVKNVLISVFNKSGLEELVPALVEANPDVKILSTGGTYKMVADILGYDSDNHLVEVADYTGFPEMEGGLVKTLHPKIHAGILGERGNPDHQKYLESIREDNPNLAAAFDCLKRMDGADPNVREALRHLKKLKGDGTEHNAVYLDMVIANLYPFQDMVGKVERGEINPKTGEPYNFESARGNIDIGGPTMLRAAAKNFLSCAAVCDTNDYGTIIEGLRYGGGTTDLRQRFGLAVQVFRQTHSYDGHIAEYFGEQFANGVAAFYGFGRDGGSELK